MIKLNFMRLVSAALIFIVILYFLVAWALSSLILIPDRKISEQKQIAYIEAKKHSETFFSFKFNNRKNEVVKGWYQKTANANCVLVFVHGWGATRLQSRDFSAAIKPLKCDLVSYDSRGHGQHEGTFVSGGLEEKYDLIQITEWLKQSYGWRSDQIAWFGVSWGASTALQAAAHYSDIAFVVADSPFKSWDAAIFERGIELYGNWVTWFRPSINLIIKLRAGIWYKDANIVAQAKDIQTPVLIIHSRADYKTASIQSIEIAKALKPGHYEFYHTQWGSDHIDDIAKQPEAYQLLVRRFIKNFAPSFLNKK